MNRLITTSLLAGAIAIAGCSRAVHPGNSTTQTMDQEKKNPSKQVSISPEVATNINEFSFRLLHALETDLPEDETYIVSPLSLHMDLGMVLQGASGVTREEILTTLGLQGKDLTQVNKDYQTLLTQLPKADSAVELGLYNSIWYNKNWTFKKSFIEGTEKNFEATVTPLPFKTTDNTYINQWAREKTNGRIDNILDYISSEDVMFLMNALYFKGDWADKFDKALTAPADFYLDDDATTISVEMMHHMGDYETYADENYTAVRLPYGNGKFSMTVLLPATGKKLTDVFTAMNLDSWKSLSSQLTKKKIYLGLPRFTVPQYEIRLNGVLSSMGMETAFSDNADFSNMADLAAGSLKVSFIKQNTFLKVDEVGTEAAAVTTTGMMLTSAPISEEITLDRPFGVIISENTTGTILFMGKMMHPQSK